MDTEGPQILREQAQKFVQTPQNSKRIKLRHDIVLFVFYNYSYILETAPSIPPSEFFMKLNRYLGRFPIQGMLKPSQPLWDNLCRNLRVLEPYLAVFFNKEHRERYRYTISEPENLANQVESGSRHCMLHCLSILVADLIWIPNSFEHLKPWLNSDCWNKEKKAQIRQFVHMMTMHKQALTVHSVLDSIKSDTGLEQSGGITSYWQEYKSQSRDFGSEEVNNSHVNSISEKLKGLGIGQRIQPEFNLSPDKLNESQRSLVISRMTNPPKLMRTQVLEQAAPSLSLPTGVNLVAQQLSSQKLLERKSSLTPEATFSYSQGSSQLSSGEVELLHNFKSSLRRRFTASFFKFVCYTLLYFTECYPKLYHKSLRAKKHKQRSASCIR